MMLVNSHFTRFIQFTVFLCKEKFHPSLTAFKLEGKCSKESFPDFVKIENIKCDHF